jgi:hypothetical protein
MVRWYSNATLLTQHPKNTPVQVPNPYCTDAAYQLGREVSIKSTTY